MSWAALALVCLGQVVEVQPEDVFPARLGIEWDESAVKSGPQLGTAKMVVSNQVDISTWAKFIDYFGDSLQAKTIDPGSYSVYQILRNGLHNGITAGDRGASIPEFCRWFAFADGTVGFEWANAYNFGNGTNYGTSTGGYANALAVDTGLPNHSKDQDGNETGINTSEHGKRFRVFRWLRYKRSVEGVETFEWWQLWRIHAHVSGAAGAWEEYTDKMGVYGDINCSSFGTNVVASVGRTATYAPQYWQVIANPATYGTPGNYQVMTASVTFQAYYGTAASLNLVDKDILQYLKDGFGKHLNSFFALYGAGKDFYWEHCRSAAESQLYWWQHAGALGYPGGTLPADYLGDVVNGFKEGFGGSGNVPIPWSAIQAYKSMSTGERTYYVEHVGSRDWDGDGWSNAFERKHGYSFQDFFDKPGDYDKDGYLDSLDLDIDGDGTGNEEDTDDDGDGVDDDDEFSDYKWLDNQLRRRPQFYDRITNQGRIGAGTAETQEQAKGVYTYDGWIDNCYDETLDYLFRWDDVHPGVIDGPTTTWEPDLVPYANQDENERIPITNGAGGTLQSASPEQIDPYTVPYRGKEPGQSDGYGPGWVTGPNDTYDGWGADEGDWYAPPHKLGETQGTGLDELTGNPSTVTLSSGTVDRGHVEQALTDFLEALGFTGAMEAVAPGEGQYSDYGGYVTFNVPGVGYVSFPVFMLPDPNTPMGQALETARVYMRALITVIFVLVWMSEVAGLFMPPLKGAK